MKNQLLPMVALACGLLIAAPRADAQNAATTTKAAPASIRVAVESGPLLHPLFSDNAVLQRDRAIPVWGFAAPGQSVSLQLDDTAPLFAKANASGRWTVKIGPLPAGGPHSITVKSGAQTLRRANILFGDVWMISGQSNAGQSFGEGNAKMNDAEQEIAAANDPQLRLFQVGNTTAATPRSVPPSDANWQPCTPESMRYFSAFGYLMGRDLHRELKVPIGVINSSWAGTAIDSWTGDDALLPFDDVKVALASRREWYSIPFEKHVDDWFKKADKGEANGFARADFDDANWPQLTMDSSWESTGKPELASFDGIVWFRRKVDIPAAFAGHDLTISFGNVDDMNTAYWNGERIGQTLRVQTPSTYVIPAAKVRAGENTLALRVLDLGGPGGFGAPTQLQSAAPNQEPMGLNREWKYAVGAAKTGWSTMPPEQFNPTFPAVIYNAKIAPLFPFALKGIAWYQGESDEVRPGEYSQFLPAMIANWRAGFAPGDVPFLIVQLPGYRAPDAEPTVSNWTLLREAQAQSAAKVANAHLLVTVDLGDEDDVHPRNKQDMARRAAGIALEKVYGQNVESSGPTFVSATPDGNAMVLQMAHIAGGMRLIGEGHHVFAVAGEDKKFHWANVQFEGDKLRVSSPEVPKPMAVRFGWSSFPRATLYNGAWLPAAQFRSDNW